MARISSKARPMAQVKHVSVRKGQGKYSLKVILCSLESLKEMREAKRIAQEQHIREAQYTTVSLMNIPVLRKKGGHEFRVGRYQEMSSPSPLKLYGWTRLLPQSFPSLKTSRSR